MKRRERKSGKRKWIRRVLLLVFVCIIAAGAYIITQYYQGLSEASEGQYKDDGTTFIPFEGSEPQFGEINVLMIGSDTRGEERGLSDTIMIANYNQETHDIKLASIMRDTYVEIPGYGMQKINAAFAFDGPELLRQTLKQTFDIDLHYYAVVDFEGFSKIADIIAPDGIEVDIPHQMSEDIGMTLEPGRQVLHGDELLGYVRFRKDADGDYGRVQRQQEIIGKLKDEAVSIHGLMKLPKLLGVADPYIDTNVDSKTILTIGKGLISGSEHPMETLRIPVDNSYQNVRTDVGAVLEIDAEQNKQALEEFLSADRE
ncbi:transcriptional regulator [Oceanobacillus oncorhynchi subsp. incaldanensis]|uniref:Regulatory protein MsrR n=2 Tax=Oceanobacillus TaxID=182709 RepID=A0A0A1MBL7_9BACI|nr:LCP family protein [Oceanobacillus oncorhynchi]MDM8101680.1 LCP family protein [Oceanobacillus oncorhynchi]UUI41323.1 LCP family protein [Oceanobacillus oncorhynchi]GIO20484.1 transcriptional regulator [Oceanobacillus oncorhynchi subsp. incaldanensis]CEI82740.1 Regulatory protein MsrR [Oceanobacillus oncorhynchi]